MFYNIHQVVQDHEAVCQVCPAQVSEAEQGQVKSGKARW